MILRDNTEMNRTIIDRLGVVAAAIADDPRQAPRAARAAGFGGLLFDAWSSSLSLPDLSRTGRREFLRMLSAQDQQLIGLQTDVVPKGFSPGADVDRQVAQLDRALETAAGLQSPLLCVDLGPLPRPAVAPKPKASIAPGQAGLIIIPTLSAPAPPTPSAPPPDPAFVAQVTSALSELGARADRYGATVAFSSALASFAAIEQALLAVRCPWFGIDLDSVAMLRDDWSPDEIFSAIGPLIRHVRARDALVGADHRTKPTIIGQGNTNWAELLALLDQAGYNGFVTVDPMELTDRSSAAAAGAKHLRELPG